MIKGSSGTMMMKKNTIINVLGVKILSLFAIRNYLLP